MKQCNNVTMKQCNRGFGLLEVLLASGVLIMVVGATVTLNRVSIKNSIISSDRTQAQNLTRQALELVRNIRDNTWIDQKVNSWHEGLSIGGPYYLYFGLDPLIGGQEQWFLKDGEETIDLDNVSYTRSIFVEQVDQTLNDELIKYDINNTAGDPLILKIKVVVKWLEYGQEWSTEGAMLLSDWKPGY